jgi:hypothetical protein
VIQSLSDISFFFVSFQIWEGGKLSWHVKYQRVQARDAKEGGSVLARGGPEGAQEGEGGSSTFLRGPRLRHRLEVKKDDVQAVIPISKVNPFKDINMTFNTEKTPRETITRFVIIMSPCFEFQ